MAHIPYSYATGPGVGRVNPLILQEHLSDSTNPHGTSLTQTDLQVTNLLTASNVGTENLGTTNLTATNIVAETLTLTNGLYLPNVDADQTLVNHFSAFNFDVVGWSGPRTTPNVNLTVIKVGNLCIASFPPTNIGVNATASTHFTYNASLEAIYRPSYQVNWPIFVRHNGADVNGLLVLTTGGQFLCYRWVPPASSFVSGQECGIYACTVTWIV